MEASYPPAQENPQCRYGFSEHWKEGEKREAVSGTARLYPSVVGGGREGEEMGTGGTSEKGGGLGIAHLSSRHSIVSQKLGG